MSANRSWAILSPLSSYIENIEPRFMNSIWGFCLPVVTSIQSWAPTCRVKLGFVAAPWFTVQVPSLILACQVPPPSPLMSYCTVAFVPPALSERNLPGMFWKISLTVGICVPSLEREQVHASGDREHRARDVPR